MKGLTLVFLVELLFVKGIAQLTVNDIDGNTYHTITIGKQTWMVENLKVTRYRDGSPIPLIREKSWSNLMTGAYCLPVQRADEYKNKYGLLYNYYVITDKRGLCPKGWHVPTASEWHTLVNYYGGVDVAGKHMRDISSGLWEQIHGPQDRICDFKALPAGGRGRFGNIEDVGFFATWWSSTSEDKDFAWHWGLYPTKDSIRYNPGHKNSGFSIRCIKD